MKYSTMVSVPLAMVRLPQSAPQAAVRQVISPGLTVTTVHTVW